MTSTPLDIFVERENMYNKSYLYYFSITPKAGTARLTYWNASVEATSYGEALKEVIRISPYPELGSWNYTVTEVRPR